MAVVVAAAAVVWGVVLVPGWCRVLVKVRVWRRGRGMVVVIFVCV